MASKDNQTNKRSNETTGEDSTHSADLKRKKVDSPKNQQFKTNRLKEEDLFSILDSTPSVSTLKPANETVSFFVNTNGTDKIRFLTSIEHNDEIRKSQLITRNQVTKHSDVVKLTFKNKEAFETFKTLIKLPEICFSNHPPVSTDHQFMISGFHLQFDPLSKPVVHRALVRERLNENVNDQENKTPLFDEKMQVIRVWTRGVQSAIFSVSDPNFKQLKESGIDKVFIGLGEFRITRHVDGVATCMDCGLPGHATEDCNYEVVRCTKCALNHYTSECDLYWKSMKKDRIFKCCNCAHKYSEEPLVNIYHSALSAHCHFRRDFIHMEAEKQDVAK